MIQPNTIELLRDPSKMLVFYRRYLQIHFFSEIYCIEISLKFIYGSPIDIGSSNDLAPNIWPNIIIRPCKLSNHDFIYGFTLSACVTLWRQIQTRFIPCESSDQCTNMCKIFCPHICIRNKTLSPTMTITAWIFSATEKMFGYALARWCWQFLYTLAFDFCTHSFTISES